MKTSNLPILSRGNEIFSNSIYKKNRRGIFYRYSGMKRHFLIYEQRIEKEGNQVLLETYKKINMEFYRNRKTGFLETNEWPKV